MQKIKKGDKVVVLSGKDKGRSGIVLEVHIRDNCVVVENINIVKRHQKQNQKQEGGIISKEAPIHLSNVAILDVTTGRPTRIGFIIEDGKKLRVSKRSGEKIDG
ncbi:50S ribosomal protein L24 [Bartonella sp. TP]|uniref:50S ribosomal protein L24 n=1 Tax=Bartonella sp. TP TaxID=3057550 RepID=UPI0025AF092C|nr:50S ribosomal protein L24 [Bartonella sp. TP]MDN5248684.1 50S ribosomal protein L24 [Alphaproteobacteria bacterium]WJW79818.1 50S ribosomal protein L24 [Bartonella sp. TP]